MKCYLGAVLVVLGVALSARTAEPTLKEARQRWLKGNYEEARTQYEALIKDPKFKATAAVGISRVHQSLGEYEKGLSVVATALKDDGKNADLQARHAEVLHLIGRWDKAEKAAHLALAVNPKHFLARWVLAQLYADRGELKKAETEFRWFVRTYSERSNNDDDIKDPDELLIVGLAGTEHARW